MAGRVLALDYGQKRVGIAVSDELRITAQPRGFLPRSPKLLEEIESFVSTENVSEIVLGYPLSMNGQAGAMAKEVEAFKSKLEAAVNVPISLYDERLTTTAAEKFLIHADVSRKRRKEVRDTIAAVFILEGYLRSKSAETTNAV